MAIDCSGSLDAARRGWKQKKPRFFVKQSAPPVLAHFAAALFSCQISKQRFPKCSRGRHVPLNLCGRLMFDGFMGGLFWRVVPPHELDRLMLLKSENSERRMEF